MDINKPNYILKFNESVSKTIKDRNYKIKKAVLIIIAIIIVGSLIFQENLFSELGWSSRIILISLFIGTLFTVKKEKIASPIEIRFYNDYLVVYREKRWYSDKVSRMEFNKFYYKDITKCDFSKNTKRFNIVGKINATWYDYNKDNGVPDNPTYHRNVDGGICYFYTDLETNLDIVKEIEEHSTIKVEVM